MQSNRGKERDKSSVEREFNDIIRKDFRSIIGHNVGKIPKGRKKPTLEFWVKEKEEGMHYAGFGKTIVFTDLHAWHSEKIAKTYNQKYLVEDDFKLLNDVLLIPIGLINHRKGFNIRAHIFLCIIGMLFYRYLAWKCKDLSLSLRRLVEELEEIRLALVQGNASGKVEMVVEEMDVKQARLFSLLDFGDLLITK